MLEIIIQRVLREFNNFNYICKHLLLQGIFPTGGSNLNLLYWQADSLSLNYQGSEAYNYRTRVSFLELEIKISQFGNLISSVQSLSYVWLFATPWTAACQASLSITNSKILLKLMSIESVMPSNHLILCCPLLFPPSVFPSIRVFFQWVSSLHQVAKVLEFQHQHQSFQWIFRINFL